MRALAVAAGWLASAGVVIGSLWRASRRADRDEAWREEIKWADQLTDEQVDRLSAAIRDHPAGHQPTKRYYR